MKGKEFWMGFMDSYLSNITGGATVTVSSSVNTTGTIEIPLAGFSQAFSINANSSVELLLPTLLVLNSGNMITNNTGVYVTTQDSVYVSLVSSIGENEDATSILPTYALGYDYFATTYLDPPNTNWGTPEALIVATEDNTQIYIEPSGFLSNQQMNPINITLNKGECYQIQSYWSNTPGVHDGNDLSGTLIQSVCNSDGIKHPISVFSGNKCTIVGGVNCSGCDHLQEQLTDYHTWGRDYVIVPPQDRNDYILKVVGASNGTIINITGLPAQTINSGGSLQFALSGERYLTSNQPVSVALITYGQACSIGSGDPMMSFMVPADQMCGEWHFQQFDLQNFHAHYLTIVTPTTNINNVFLDGALLPAANFSNFTPNAVYSKAVLSLPNGGLAHQITSSGGFHAYPHGYIGAGSYYFNSGLSLPNLEPDFDIGYLQDTTNYPLFEDTICACEPVSFIAHYYDPTVTIDWDFGDGGIGSGFNTSHTYLNGVYDVTLILRDANGCAFDTLIKESLVVENCDITLSNYDTLCIGESVTLTANNGSTFIWSTGATTSSITVSPSVTTIYTLQVDGGATSICDSVIIYVHPLYDIGFNDTLKFCENDTAIVFAPANLSQYLWSNGNTSDSMLVNMSGLYWLEVEDTNGCAARDSFEVVIDQVPIWDLGPDLVSCVGAQVVLIGPSITNGQYDWSTLETTPNIAVTLTGEYTLEVDDGVCLSSDSIYIAFNEPPVPSFDNEIYLCAADLLLENPNNLIVDYIWSTGETSPSIIVTESGTYWVQMSNNCGAVTDTIDVIFDCTYSIYIPNAFTPDGDGINDFFHAKGTGIEDFEMRIFNRWGEQIFFSDNITYGWNGYFKSIMSKSDVYVWVVRVRDIRGQYHKLRGHVTLVK